MVLAFQNGVKRIQIPGYNGERDHWGSKEADKSKIGNFGLKCEK